MAESKFSSVAPELLAFLRPYGSEVSNLFLQSRQAVRDAAPNVNELIYDAYNAVSCAFSYSDRLNDAFCHVAAYNGYVNLGFNQGANLADPHKLLMGDGLLIRHIRISKTSDLNRLGIAQLLKLAVTQGKMQCKDNTYRNAIIIKSTSGAKRRPV
ncbi:MAG: DUF1801 domain-containing protein [Pseudohongiellaceae bacterium]